MEKVKIIPPKKSEFDQIYLLLEQLWSDKDLNRDRLRNIFLRGILSVDQYYFIAKYNKKIVGFSSLTIKNNLWQEGNLAHIDEIIVDRDFRGKGIGKNLMEKLCEIARSCDCKKIEFDSALNRKDANNFYEKLDFKNRATLYSKDL